MNPASAPSIAIVTARGGSKRIPGKNIRLFHGKPLITWTIENLIKSEIFADVIVSTDSADIAEIARESGARVPFMRPAELADDFATTAQVADHAITSLVREGVADESAFCIVYPAAVGVSKEDLTLSKKMFDHGRLDLVFAGCEFPSPPERGWVQTPEGLAVPIQPSIQGRRTQDFQPSFHDAGQFYWSHSDTWALIIDGKDSRRGLFVMPRWRAIDIDTEEDWAFAEIAFQASIQLRDRH